MFRHILAINTMHIIQIAIHVKKLELKLRTFWDVDDG